MGLQAAEFSMHGAASGACNTIPSTAISRSPPRPCATPRCYCGTGWFADRTALDGFVADLKALQQRPKDRYLTWMHGLVAMQDERLKLAELHNWLERPVMPGFQRRH